MGEKEEKGRGKRIILLEKELRGMGGRKGIFLEHAKGKEEIDQVIRIIKKLISVN